MEGEISVKKQVTASLYNGGQFRQGLLGLPLLWLQARLEFTAGTLATSLDQFPNHWRGLQVASVEGRF